MSIASRSKGGTNDVHEQLKADAKAPRVGEILKKTNKVGECLVWTGPTFKKPDNPLWQYPMIQHEGKCWRGNRLVWTLINGPIPKGLFINHRCDNNLCINPDHLYCGDQFDNMRDTYTRGRARNAKVNTCPHGHPYSGNNLRVDKVRRRRHCKTCGWYRWRKMWPPPKELIYEG
jgi:hypothetical protein